MTQPVLIRGTVLGNITGFCLHNTEALCLFRNKPAHCTKNNLNLCIKTEVVPGGADATVYSVYFCPAFVYIYLAQKPDIFSTAAAAPTVTESVFKRLIK